VQHDTNAQLEQLILLVLSLKRRLANVEDVAARASQNVQVGYPGGFGGGGGGTAGFMGYATVNIAARTFPGTSLAAGGQVDVYQDVSGVLTATGSNVIARCAVSRVTAAGHGIDANSWCWVEQDPYGTYWASPLDCT
jgi:hypothetical protein